MELDGVPRMVIYASTDNQTDDNYLYYVGDFTTEGYAPILEVQNGSESGYFVDGHYNLYYGALSWAATHGYSRMCSTIMLTSMSATRPICGC